MPAVRHILGHTWLVAAGATSVALVLLIARLRSARARIHEPQRSGPPGSLCPHIFPNERGQWIHTRRWPVGSPKAYIFIAHGLGEHIGRYEHVARYLNSRGFYVLGMDHHAHGQSDGTKGLVSNFHHLVDDFLLFAQRTEVRGLPRFILGHAMGGAVAVEATARMPQLWRGTILCAPMLNADSKMLKTAHGSDSQQVLQSIRHDALMYHGSVLPRTALSMTEGADYIAQIAPQIEWPFLLVHGEDDTLSEGASQFVAAVKSADKVHKIWPALQHNLLADSRWETVLDGIVQWVDKRLGSRSTYSEDSVGPLNSQQYRAMLASWEAIERKGMESVGESVFHHFFRIQPKALNLFPFRDAGPHSPACRKHAAMVLASLGNVVKDLGNSKKLGKLLSSLAATHAVGYGTAHGLREEFFTSFGKALMLALEEALGMGWTEEVRLCWTDVYGLLFKSMMKAVPKHKR